MSEKHKNVKRHNFRHNFHIRKSNKTKFYLVNLKPKIYSVLNSIFIPNFHHEILKQKIDITVFCENFINSSNF